MGPRNLLILFFSTVAVSLVILIIFFSLFFKNVDLNFNTRLPESAPDIGRQFETGPTMNPESKADGLMRSTVNVPPEFKEPEPAVGGKPGSNSGKAEEEVLENDLPPISDDVLLDSDSPLPPMKKPSVHESEKPAATTEKPATSSSRPEPRTVSPPPASPAPATPAPRPRRVETPPAAPAPMPEPIEEPASSGPPVPGQ